MKMLIQNRQFTTAACALTMLCMTQSASAACNETGIAPNTPDIRYSDNGDGTVTDKLTHLVWMKCVVGLTGEECKTGLETKLHWKQALQNQVLLNADGGFAGYTDWRLPNRKELASLINNQCTSPAINETLFPEQSTIVSVWTSTPDPNDATRSWSVNFRYGDIKREKRSDIKLLRLVRDAD